MKKQQDLIRKHFQDLGLKITEQKFRDRQLSKREAVDFDNLVFSYAPERDRRIIICSHYDTRPIADQEPDERKWHEPFVSANDGGSGVVVMMELANHLKDLDIRVGVDFVCFDGEEYVFHRDDEYFFGSKYFARQWKNVHDRTGRPTYLGAVLLDMVGGKDPSFKFEPYSRYKNRDLCEEIWAIADAFQCKAFERRPGREVWDDHRPLNDAGIPAIDVIDWDPVYPHWHKLTDVPANCSADSLTQVGKVLSVWMQRVR